MKKKRNKIIAHNEELWNKQAESHCAWSQPVSSETIEMARKGIWEVHITKKPLPKDWLEQDIRGKDVLCLASAGGQQAPILAAAGANVTVFDISQGQLDQDALVAKRDKLSLKTIQGDMTSLDSIKDESFDYIIHPISNLYIPDLTSLWSESYRVLRKKGILLASFYNPVLFVFERNKELSEQGLLKPKYSLPYSDKESLEKSEYEEKLKNGEFLVFGHSLSEQIQKQIDAGFLISGFYEDEHPSPRFLIENYMPTMIATKAVKGGLVF